MNLFFTSCDPFLHAHTPPPQADDPSLSYQRSPSHFEASSGSPYFAHHSYSYSDSPDIFNDYSVPSSSAPGLSHLDVLTQSETTYQLNLQQALRHHQQANLYWSPSPVMTMTDVNQTTAMSVPFGHPTQPPFTDGYQGQPEPRAVSPSRLSTSPQIQYDFTGISLSGGKSGSDYVPESPQTNSLGSPLVPGGASIPPCEEGGGADTVVVHNDVSPTMYTSDAASKETLQLRRRCFNCHATKPPSWRRSTLHPGKIVCNKCGLYERTHSRPRPHRFDGLLRDCPPIPRARKNSKSIITGAASSGKASISPKARARKGSVASLNSTSSSSVSSTRECNTYLLVPSSAPPASSDFIAHTFASLIPQPPIHHRQTECAQPATIVTPSPSMVTTSMASLPGTVMKQNVRSMLPMEFLARGSSFDTTTLSARKRAAVERDLPVDPSQHLQRLGAPGDIGTETEWHHIKIEATMSTPSVCPSSPAEVVIQSVPVESA
ncbi:hypothetical protein FRB95_000099 [Tulasnella sp. JGI-2019a]|nr:hypothetical protein FRB95_000099 [Tulasnella sp. JGI-2019a]